MNSNPLWAQWEAQRSPQALFAAAAALPEASAIPPRAWLYGTRLIRGFVSVLAAPGGVGKSSLALGQAMALASGKPILGERVHRSVPVWVLNLEDPLEEMHRRVAALMRLHQITTQELAGRLFLHSGRDRRITMAAADGHSIVHPDRDGLIGAAKAAGIGLLVVDPFVKSHTLDENANGDMDAAATAWAEVAHATGAAVLLVHHVRKSAGDGVEAMRGAKALSDAARAACLLTPMSEEEGRALAVPERERWRHVRLDDAKANLAPRAEAAVWYRLETVALGNATEEYPAGDAVGAIVPWKPPSPLRGLSGGDCNKVLDLIAAGDGEGAAFSAHRTGRAAGRWAGQVLVEHFGFEPDEAARVIAAWLRSGLLVEAEYRHPVQRKSRLGLRVVDAKRPTEAKPQQKG
jgi:hypothetical protein